MCFITSGKLLHFWQSHHCHFLYHIRGILIKGRYHQFYTVWVSIEQKLLKMVALSWPPILKMNKMHIYNVNICVKKLQNITISGIWCRPPCSFNLCLHESFYKSTYMSAEKQCHHTLFYFWVLLTHTVTKQWVLQIF